jgi:pyruvate,water dikinase
MSPAHSTTAWTPRSQENRAQRPSYIVRFDQISLEDLSSVGGKNASLGEMVRELGRAGVRVPDGYAITVDAYHLHLREADVESFIYDALDRLDVIDTRALAQTAQSIRQRILQASLCRASNKDLLDVAVRSSATAEDLPAASFAGQQETFLNIRGETALLSAVRACMASLHRSRDRKWLSRCRGDRWRVGLGRNRRAGTRQPR